MRKVLKTQGSSEQWIRVIQIAMDQMGLTSTTTDSVVTAFYDDQPLMKFQIKEQDGTYLAIDYLDDRDLDDFKGISADIFAHYDEYSEAYNKRMAAEALSVQQDPVSPDTEPAQREATTFSSEERDLDLPNEAVEDTPKKKKGKKGFIIALCIVLGLAVLGVGGYFGYKLYQNKTIPPQILAEAQAAFASEDYDSAEKLANQIINEYADSNEYSEALSIVEQIQAAREAKKAEEEKQAAIEEARKVIRITSTDYEGPDGGEASYVYINFLNQSDKAISVITFRVNFKDANGNAITVDDQDSVDYDINYDGPFAKDEGQQDNDFRRGPYYNADAVGYDIVGVYITYEDDSTFALGSKEEVDSIIY